MVDESMRKAWTFALKSQAAMLGKAALSHTGAGIQT